MRWPYTPVAVIFWYGKGMGMALNRDKLAKILALTDSNIDGEVLAAIRSANSMIKKSGTTWPQLISPPSKPKKPTRKSSIDYAAIINKFLKDYGEDLSDGTFDFISSLREFADEKGYLSSKQVAALHKIMEQVM